MNNYQVNVYENEIDKIINNNNKNFVVIGNVQSGKTKFIIGLVEKLIKNRKNIIVLTRNSLNDLIQLNQRIPNEMKKYKNLFITMSSANRLKKLINELEAKEIKDYHLVIDEADMVFKDASRKFNGDFTCLLEKSSQNVYVSATSITCLFKVKNKQILYLKPPENYIGADKIDIDYSFQCELDPYKKIFKKETSLVLHKTSPKIKIQIQNAITISSEYNNCVCCVFNSLGYKLYKNGERIKEYNKKLALNKIISILTLQYPHVVIIAGHIASRGLSFVSEDYSIHLTDEIMLLGKKSRGDTIVQGLRLLGVFNDNIKPKLFTDFATYEEIMKYLQLQKVLYKKGNPEETEDDIVYNIKFKGDIPKRKTIYNNKQKVDIKKTNSKSMVLILKQEA